MDLLEYLLNCKKTHREIAAEMECSPTTISNIRLKKFTPTMLIFAKLSKLSKGSIKFLDVLSEEDKKKYVEWDKKKSK